MTRFRFAHKCRFRKASADRTIFCTHRDAYLMTCSRKICPRPLNQAEDARKDAARRIAMAQERGHR